MNGPRSVVVQIQTGSGVYAWVVVAGERLTLLDEDQGTPGYLWVFELPSATQSCGALSSVKLGSGSMTIAMSGAATGGAYEIEVQDEATGIGSPRTDYAPACSG